MSSSSNYSTAVRLLTSVACAENPQSNSLSIPLKSAQLFSAWALLDLQMFNIFTRSFLGSQRGLRQASAESSVSPVETSEINTPVATGSARPLDRYMQNGQPNFLPIYDVTRYAELLPEFNSSLFSHASEGVERAFMLRYTQKLISLVHSAKTSDEQLMNNPFECRFAVPKSDIAGNPRVPSFHSDAAFVLKMTQRCCFSLATVLAGLDYFVRLIDKGLVRLHHTSWRSLWVCCMLLAEKMWEDNFVHPAHIMGQYSTSAHTKREYLQLQMGILKVLNWDMNITLKRFTDLVADIMAYSVSPEVFGAVPGHPDKLFVPRPLPKVPKMNFNLSSRLRQQNSRVSSRHGRRFDAGVVHTTSSSNSSIGAASTVAESRPDVYNDVHDREDEAPITSLSQARPMPAARDRSFIPSRRLVSGQGNARFGQGSLYRSGVGLPPRQPTPNRRFQPRQIPQDKH